MLLRHRGMSQADVQKLIDHHPAKSDPRGGTGGTLVGGPERVGKDTDPPIVRPSPQQNETSSAAGGDDDPDDEYSDFAGYLRDAGVDEEAINGAIDAHRRSRAMDRRRKANGRDKVPSRGGHFERPRFTRDEFPTPQEIVAKEAEQWDGHASEIIDHGLDAALRHGGRDRREIAAVRKLLKRFGPEAGAEPERYRGAADGERLRPTERQKERLHRLIPSINLIGTVSEDGVGRRDPGRKSLYEV